MKAIVENTYLDQDDKNDLIDKLMDGVKEVLNESLIINW